MPGRGGISRGPGDAALLFSGETDQHRADMQAKKLPPSRVRSDQWELVGLSRQNPETAPERATDAGTAGAVGSGTATERRRLSPGQREVIRRYFSGDKD